MSDQDWAACNFNLRTAGQQTTNLWEVSCHCIKKKALLAGTWALSMTCHFHLYYSHYITMISYKLIISDIRNAFWMHIRCRKLANRQGISEHTNQEHQGLNHQAPKRLLPRSCSDRPVQIGLADVRQPTSTQFMFELITQYINSRCNGCALFLPAIPRSIQTCNIIDIIGLIRIIHINKWYSRNKWNSMVSYDSSFFF